MAQYPLQSFVHAHSVQGAQSLWTSSADGLADVVCAVPEQFDGPGGGYSPEDLYAMALSNCFLATFKVMAEKSKVAFQEVSLKSKLLVDRDEKGRPWMKELVITVALRVSGAEIERMARLLERVSRSCLIINSVKTSVLFVWDLEAL